MKGFRRQRAAEQIRRELTQILDTEFPDEDLPSFYIHKVELSPDMGLARALLTSSTVGGKLDEDEVMRPLRRLAPKIRASLVKRIQFRRAPNVVFQVDRGLEHKERIDSLLDRIKKRTPPTDLTAFLLAAALWPLFALAPARAAETPALESFEAEAQVMGTTFRIAAYGPEKRRLANVVYGAFDEAKRINNLISNYRDDSELSRLNQADTGAPIDLSPETMQVFAEALRIGELTGGAFDVTVGPLVNAWGFGPGERTPSLADTELDRLRAAVGWGKIAVGDTTVTKLADGVYCDLSAVAKGFGVDQAARALDAHGHQNYMVEIGGEVLARGVNGEGRAWRIGIEKPSEAGQGLQGVIELDGMAMATSGDYRNFWEEDGVRYSHTIDPRTGRPVRHQLASVTVLEPTCMRADGFATALMALGEDEGYGLAERLELAALFQVRTPDGGFIERTTPAYDRLAADD